MAYEYLKKETITKVTCDICGYTAITESIIPCNTGIRSLEYDLGHMHYHKDLCKNCMTKLHIYLEKEAHNG